MSAKKNSNSNKKSGGAGFIVPLLLLSWLTNFSFSGIIIGVLLGLGIGKITSIMGSGLDTTTHNKRDLERQKKEEELRRQEDEKKQQEAERIRREAEKEAERKRQEDASRIPLTGNEAADAVITKGTEMLRTIRAENEAIPDVVLSGQMESLCQKCEQIFRTVSDSPSKAPQVRKFMSYYLPTTLKMLANYRMMQQRGVSYLEMNQARETTIRGMNMILTPLFSVMVGISHLSTIFEFSSNRPIFTVVPPISTPNAYFTLPLPPLRALRDSAGISYKVLPQHCIPSFSVGS